MPQQCRYLQPVTPRSFQQVVETQAPDLQALKRRLPAAVLDLEGHHPVRGDDEQYEQWRAKPKLLVYRPRAQDKNDQLAGVFVEGGVFKVVKAWGYETFSASNISEVLALIADIRQGYQ